jgi:hypothetical protein
MNTKWPLVGLATFGGSALTLLGLVLLACRYGAQPSIGDMGLAAGLGGAIGVILTLM